MNATPREYDAGHSFSESCLHWGICQFGKNASSKRTFGMTFSNQGLAFSISLRHFCIAEVSPESLPRGGKYSCEPVFISIDHTLIFRKQTYLRYGLLTLACSLPGHRATPTCFARKLPRDYRLEKH